MSKQPTKYVFVTGGVLSGLGKGITAASLARLLKARGLSVNIQKCDPYLNRDAGLLNPAEHGECFVTRDGAETDLDLGHYERFMDQELTQSSSLMSGRVLEMVLRDERNGKYGGKTVQFIPHVTTAIQREIVKAGKGYDVHIVEIGGTVGDYEALSFIEAIRELAQSVGRENYAFVHVVYLPYLGASKEIKTKPAQNAVKDLRGLGIVPDILVARSEDAAPKSSISKLSMFSGVSPEAIALLPNAPSIYEVPMTLETSGISSVLLKRLGLKSPKPKLKDWEEMVKRARAKNKQSIRVGVVAKYMDNEDTYMSVFEALTAAAMWQDVSLDITWINAEKIQDTVLLKDALSDVDGIVVPGGFGTRALEGKIAAAQEALRTNVPYLGLCLGLQMAVVAAARNAGVEDATSEEIDPASQKLVISTMPGQEDKQNTGGTMRLGDYPSDLEKGSIVRKLYGKSQIVERHRHRYECNNAFRGKYQSWGIKASGLSPDGTLVEFIEGIDHPFFVASQAHPEFKSRPNKPHPLFSGFISACQTEKKQAS